MYRYEIAWYEPTEVIGTTEGRHIKDVYHYKGFKTQESYDRKLKQIEKKGYRIVGKIEDGKEVYKAI